MNYDNSTLSKNNMYASVRSNSTFFAIDGHFYLNTSSDKGRAVQIIEFEKINTIDGSLINPNLVFELKWEDSDWGNLYRSYPIFANINNIDYGWGLMELNRY